MAAGASTHAVKTVSALQVLLAENAEAIEPGFRVIAAGLRLGRSSIDLLGLDAHSALALIAIDFIANNATLLRMNDAYAWALEHPQSLRRLVPAGIDVGWPPRLVFVVQQLDESFRRTLGALELPAVRCFAFRCAEHDGALRLELEPLDSQAAQAPRADERKPSAASRGAIPGAPAADPGPSPAPGPASTWEAVLQKLAATPVTYLDGEAAPAPPPPAPAAARHVAPGHEAGAQREASTTRKDRKNGERALPDGTVGAVAFARAAKQPAAPLSNLLEELERPVGPAAAQPAAPPAPAPRVQDVVVAAATDASAAKGAEQAAPDDSGRWWTSAWARWTNWAGTLDFDAAVAEELAKYPYLLSVPIQKSTEYDDGLLAYGYSILLDFIEQRNDGFVTKALDSLKSFVAGAPGPGRSVGGHLYDFLVREGRLTEAYPEFVKAVLVAAVPTPGLWTQARLLESMAETTIITHPSARLGDPADSSQHLTEDTRRFRGHRFSLALPPITARFFMVASDLRRYSRALDVRLREGRSDSAEAWILTMPPAGRGNLKPTLIPLAREGTSVPGLGQDYAALWVAVFNADAHAEKEYELTLSLRKDASRSAATLRAARP